MDLVPPSLPSLYDDLYPPVSDEDLKRFHTVDRRLYGKLINILGRDPTESMKAMAFLQWLERVARDSFFVMNLYDVPSPLLNEVMDEALRCLKCAEEDHFTGNNSCEILLIPHMLKRNYFTLRYFHEIRARVIRGVTYALKMICLRAFDDMLVVQQPNDFTGACLVPSPNVVNIDHDIGKVPISNNPSHHHFPIGAGGSSSFLESMIPRENKIEEIGSLTSSRMMSNFNPSIVLSGCSNIEEMARAATRMVPINPSHVLGGASNIEEKAKAATRMVPMNPSHVLGGASNIEEIARAATRMVPMNPSHILGGASNIEEMARAARMVPMNPSHVLGGASNIEEMARAASRMVPMNPSHVLGGTSNIEEIGKAATRMVPMNPSNVLGGASNIEEIARAASRMVPVKPSQVAGAGVGAGATGGIVLGVPYVVPNQMVQYMLPYLGGSSMNLLPPSIPYNGLNFSHASSSGSGIFPPQMLPGPHNYHPDFVDPQASQAMYRNLTELFQNNLTIFNVVKKEKEVAPDDRTVFLTFSKGYPITETEVKDFFTRKFGEDVEAVYMQEVTEEEQALYARLVTRSPAALEAIVEGGKAKYNINGKHVWARKYVKKQNC
ncbi:hypothetical protein FXO38_35551 [Capsicum annuum]|uniref:RRM domain-containing protein n=1 Tax=Capsicum annuum TaxID=4072 RepID=A0A1U8F174_CAPAN|nr:hypothetical protein FXO38_35551 [Capsicum annuum]KAF3662073.1 hypothetical protein FXO37_12618 [Capsicum annuum]PHT65824.1 hypothetical protein T459_30249 [Capsicum annuum]